CPRDAKPSNVMAALRDYSITHYAVPRFMGRALSDPRALPLLFAIPAVIFLAILGWLGHLGSLPEGRIVFSRFMPIAAIEVTFLADVSGIAVIAAVAVFHWRRIADDRRVGKSTYSDWLFLSILGLTTLTGFCSQWLRLAGLRLAYPMYFVHLLFIFFLLVYIPYSKFAHLIYRTLAMLHSTGPARRAAPTRAP